MFIFSSAKVYIGKIQSVLITNELILIFLTLVETLPLISNSIVFSLSLSSYSYPKNVPETLLKISYYDLFRNQYIHNDSLSPNNYSLTYPFYYPLIAFIMYILFVLYKMFFRNPNLHPVHLTYKSFCCLQDAIRHRQDKTPVENFSTF